MQEFKLIVAGGRDFKDYGLLHRVILQLAAGEYEDRAISIVSGAARGADALAIHFARQNQVKLYEFPADWDTYGKGAGFIRNNQMAQFADGLLAFWDGQSRGTKHMIDAMKQQFKPVHIIRY